MAGTPHESDDGHDAGLMNNSPPTRAGVQPLIYQVIEQMVTQLSDGLPDIAQKQADALVEPIRTRLEQYVDEAFDGARAALSQQVDEAFAPVSAYSRRHVDELLDPATSLLHDQLGQTLVSLAPEHATRGQDQPTREPRRASSRQTSRQTSRQQAQAPDEKAASQAPARRAKGGDASATTRGREERRKDEKRDKEVDSSASRRTRASHAAPKGKTTGAGKTARHTGSQSAEGAEAPSAGKRRSRRAKSTADA